MNKTIKSIALSVTAVIAVGVAAPAALAQSPGAERVSVSAPLSGVNESQAVRQLAANLLKYEGDRFNAQERAELQAFANGTNIGTKGKLDSLVKLLKKVKGFAKAVKGSYKSFKNWYKNLPWYVKAPLAAAGVGSHLWEIWNLFH